LGGVWRENTYPGCACDVPSALYSYSFEPNPSWSRVFAGQAEIKQYLQNTAQKYQVLPHVHFQHEALSANWSDAKQCWIVKTQQGEFHAQFAIMACGPMHEPVIPNIAGLKDFQGEIFHSSRWKHDVDLTGKRVAVVGTGASATQFVPRIQPLAKQLTVFQRTPHWVLPKSDISLPSQLQTLFKYVPVTQSVMRASIYGIFESLNGGLKNNAAMRPVQRVAEHHLQKSIQDPQLRRQLTPNYVIGCKRILQSNEWYPALAQNNVTLLSSALAEVKGTQLISSEGDIVEADVIILGTGFEVAEPPIAKRVFNRHGKSVSDVWQGSPEGYMGTMVEDCPNGFLMFGPNIGVSSSAFIIIEAQMTYIIDALRQAIQQNIKTIEPNPVRISEFNQRVDEALKTTVWNKGGCQSYFIDRNGRNSTLWPWTTFKMRQQLSRFNLDEYLLDRQVEKPVEMA
jgi:cation diffusion facilitator CzcD-associated flavoprotein CzcO